LLLLLLLMPTMKHVEQVFKIRESNGKLKKKEKGHQKCWADGRQTMSAHFSGEERGPSSVRQRVGLITCRVSVTQSVWLLH
jgi:hypothetical protein